MQKITFYFLAALFMFTSCNHKTEEGVRFIVGTYTADTGSEGIYTLSLGTDTLIRQQSVAAAGVNPSFLAFSPDKKTVYAVNEDGDRSRVSAYSFEETTGRLLALNAVDARGADPCHLSVTERHVITANYSSGSLTVFGRQANGALTDAVQVIRHSGSGPDSLRQTMSHIHQVLFGPDSLLYVTDLGNDAVYSYTYHRDAAEVLVACDSLKLTPGSGPRHLAFSPGGRMAYLLCELDGNIVTLKVDHGQLTPLAQTSIATEGTDTGTADIRLSDDGRFLYATNRGTANTITVFSVDNAGALTKIQQIPSGGIMPRHAAITPDGQFYLAEHQQSHDIVVFARHTETGLLTPTNKTFSIPAPVCILFY